MVFAANMLLDGSYLQENQDANAHRNNSSGPAIKINIKMADENANGEVEQKTPMQKFLQGLMFWKPKSNLAGGKRKLYRSQFMAIWLTWPFLILGIIIIITNALGHEQLKSVTGPIATFNIVNFVNIRLQSAWFYVEVGLSHHT